MRRTILLELATVTALVMLPMTTLAAFITGSFDGIATVHSWIPQPDGPSQHVIEYKPVNGAFGFESDPSLIPYPPVREPVVGPHYAEYYGVDMRMEFIVDGSRSVFDNSIDAFGGPALILSSTPEEQHLMLRVAGPYWFAEMDFAGAANALFAGADPLTFDPLGVSVARSSATYAGSIRDGSSTIAFNRISFDGVQPVPEPGTLVLFLTAALAMFTGRRGYLASSATA